jgi:zinc-ribbon domain
VQCRNCGTEIADKALICYKCGAPTADAKYQPADIPKAGGSRSGLLASVIALALLVVLALYMGRVSAGETPRYVTWIGIALAVIVVGLRAYARRR